MIYINDLPKATQGKVSMYADDTSLYHMSNDVSKLESAINEDLELLGNWLKGNKLSLNVAKAKSMLICTKSRRKIFKSSDDTLNLLIRDRELESVDVIKYLGVYVEYSLGRKDHLGPLLFLLFINDMAYPVTKVKVNVYADDTGLTYADVKLDNVTQVINSELKNLKENGCRAIHYH